MFCPNCGNNCADGAFCPVCGTNLMEQKKVVETAPVAEPVTFVNETPTAPVVNAYPAAPAVPTYNAAPVAVSPVEALASKILTKGILAVAFGSSFVLSFLGIIFGIQAKKLVKQFEEAYGAVSGKSKVGKILGKVGLILGIVLTVLFAIYVLVIIIAVIASISNYRYYYY